MNIATAALLSQQYTSDTLVHRLELTQVGGRDFDGVSCHWQDDNILPWMELVLVLHHLRSLPVILDAGTLERKLFHFDRHWTSCLGLNHSDIVLGLNTKESMKGVRKW